MQAILGLLAKGWSIVPLAIEALNGVVHATHEVLHSVAEILKVTIQ